VRRLNENTKTVTASATYSMKIGDKVRLTRIPDGVADDREFKTRTLLEKCLGRTFTVKGFQLDGGRTPRRFTRCCWVELHVGEVIPDLLDSIWIEPDCLRVQQRKHGKVSSSAR